MERLSEKKKKKEGGGKEKFHDAREFSLIVSSSFS